MEPDSPNGSTFYVTEGNDENAFKNTPSPGPYGETCRISTTHLTSVEVCPHFGISNNKEPTGDRKQTRANDHVKTSKKKSIGHWQNFRRRKAHPKSKTHDRKSRGTNTEANFSSFHTDLNQNVPMDQTSPDTSNQQTSVGFCRFLSASSVLLVRSVGF